VPVVIDKLAIYLLWFAAVFDPIGTVLGGRYIALALIYLVLFVGFLRQELAIKNDKFNLWLFGFFVLLLPIYGLTISVLRGGMQREFIDTSYIGAAVLFCCSLVYLRKDLISVGLGALIWSLRALSLVVVLVWVTLIDGMSLDWVYFFVEKGVAYLGERTYAGVSFYYIYFIATPMIIFLMVYEAWRMSDNPSKEKLLLLALPVAALFLSGTRANILIATLGFPLIIAWRKLGWLPIFLGVSGIVLVGLFTYNLNGSFVTSMFDASESSNAMKIGYLKEFEEIFMDPVTILFGQGFNAHVWSSPFANMLAESAEAGASKTELTYLELFRVYGLLIGTWFFITVGLVIRKLFNSERDFRWLGFALLLYMVASSLNPYLFSSNGMLPLGLCAAIIFKFSATNSERKIY
jgi:hypothetical protein